MKDKIRLIRNLLILSLPLFILMAVAAIFPMTYMSPEYPLWQEERDFVHEKGGRSYERLILGDSRAKSGLIPIKFDESGNTYNMAIGGATPIEMYYAYDNYLKGHEAPKEAILIFAPYHFCDIDNFDQTLYYNYLDLGEILSLERHCALKSDGRVIAYDGWITDVISYKARFPSKYLAAVYDALPEWDSSKNLEKYAKVRASLGHTLFGTEESNNSPSYETHHEVFDSSAPVLEYYEMLLNRLEEGRVKVIIEEAPLNPVSHEGLYPAFTEGFEAFMQGVRERHPGFTVVSAIPLYEADCFGDNNHLNDKGANKFTAELKEKYHIN